MIFNKRKKKTPTSNFVERVREIFTYRTIYVGQLKF